MYTRRIRPYGEETGSRNTRQGGRWEIIPGGFYKTSLSEWKRIKRQPKKAARQAGKDEIRDQM
jgi:hypothetical protein